MNVPISYWAVVIAAIVQFVLGYLWYGPLFGKIWMKLIGGSQGNTQWPKAMGGKIGLSFVGSLLTSYILAHFLVFASVYTGATGAAAGFSVAFWAWLGLIVPITLGTVLWENKSWKLWAFNNAYQIISLTLIAVIIASWM